VLLDSLRVLRGTRFWIAPAAWVLGITALSGVALARLSWSFVDLYNLFYRATALSWRQTLGFAFAGGIEYRPLLIIGVKLAHQVVGLRAWFYKALVLLQFAAILGGLLWIFQPTTRRRAVAACIALTCVAGLHTSRVLFMFIPLNAHSFGVVLLLGGILMALSPQSRLRDWAFLPLTLTALLTLESGMLLVAVMLVLWRMKAPGASGRAVAATVIATVVYVAVRFGLGAQEATSVYTETGLGFADVSGPRLAQIFGHAPWLLWIYNVVASTLTIAASEPRAGRFLFVESILHGHVPLWMYVHIVSSVLTTGVIAYAFKTSRIPLDRDRYIAAAGVTLVVIGSALGFLYTRDRIGLSAGVGYAMLVYVAVAAVLEGRPAAFARATAAKDGRPLPVRALGLRLAQACVAVIAAGWLIRTGELYFQLRDAGWENYQEWTTRYEELGGTSRPQTDLLLLLREEALARVPDDPRNDPAWTYMLFEREFERTPQE
jgi:hypothetical protein